MHENVFGLTVSKFEGLRHLVMSSQPFRTSGWPGSKARWTYSKFMKFEEKNGVFRLLEWLVLTWKTTSLQTSDPLLSVSRGEGYKMHHHYVLATIIIILVISLFSWYFLFNITMFLSSLYILTNFSSSLMVQHHLFTISSAIIEGWKCLASLGWEYPSGERKHFQDAYY